jgi:hypothetical protein
MAWCSVKAEGKHYLYLYVLSKFFDSYFILTGISAFMADLSIFTAVKIHVVVSCNPEDHGFNIKDDVSGNTASRFTF